jgi:hypothetical protein
VDDPPYCDFIMPGIVQRGDLVIAISTSGRSPAMARKMREELTDFLTEELVAMLELAAEVRAELRNGRGGGPGGLERGLDAEIKRLLSDGRRDEAKERLLRALLEPAGSDEARALVVTCVASTTAPPRGRREKVAFSAEELRTPWRLHGELGAAVSSPPATARELYTMTRGDVADMERLVDALAACKSTRLDLRRTYFLAHDEAVRQLFRVSAGIDSMVLGESQILGQVRDAMSAPRRRIAERRPLPPVHCALASASGPAPRPASAATPSPSSAAVAWPGGISA